MALDWTTVTLDLQRAVNNLALYVLESMTPMIWNPTCPPRVDITQPPPGYGELSGHPHPDASEKPPETIVNSIKDKDKGPSKKKKALADTR